ncbi:Long-chain-fatty-acid--CoA ligase 4 [Sarcoptes scabiei]|uniref:long-chain-fatty-acid--CoA ligase n=1 Tax=Sarcoptes scabiei TaxID=52283 RepID=A0A834VDH3_SARSC|nr:Long-chain-fatty-acid--CoA ligase 4 [Sarcoptes scabiei]
MTASSTLDSTTSPDTLLMNGNEQPAVIMNGGKTLAVESNSNPGKLINGRISSNGARKRSITNQNNVAINNNNINNDNNNSKTFNQNEVSLKESNDHIMPSPRILHNPKGPSVFKVLSDFVARLLKSLFILLVHLIVFTYTYLTLPIYYFTQNPNEIVKKSHRNRAKQIDPSDPSSPWLGIFEERPKYVLDHVNTLDELCSSLKDYFSMENKALGYRKVIKEHIILGPDGKSPLRIDGRFVKKRELSDYNWITYGEMLKRKNNIALGFYNAGIQRNDCMVILCETCAEYFLVELAIARAGLRQVNVFSNLGDSGIAYAINETGAKYVFTSWELIPKIRSIISTTETKISKVIYIDQKAEVSDSVADEHDMMLTPINDVTFVSLAEIEQDGEVNGEKVKENCKPLGKDEIAFIMYTSGTTGVPKGVQATSYQMIQLLRTILPVLKEIMYCADKEMYVAYLPQAHIFEATCEFLALALGAPIGFATPFTLTDSAPGLAPGTKSDLFLLQPTIMIAVPLVLERMRKEIYSKLEKRSPISAPLFNYLMDYKIRWTKKGYRTPIVNKLLCRKIREQFGGRLKKMILGGAPLSASLQALIKAALDVTLLQGYGMTETLGACLCMDDDDLSYGRCGKPLFGVHAKLDEWAEGDYRITDKPCPRGELLIGSKANSVGYLDKPEMNSELYVKDDQLGITWFRTGDIAEVHPDGTFKIIDRKKDLVKLANGEYFSLGKIESILKNCSYVDNICVFGNALANYLVALILPNANRFGRLAKSYRVPKSESDTDPRLIKIVLKSLRETGMKNGLKKVEIPLKIRILFDEWTPDNGMLTAAMKLRRSTIKTRYSPIIEELFTNLDNKDVSGLK